MKKAIIILSALLTLVACNTEIIEIETETETTIDASKVVFKINKYDVFTNDSLLRLLESEIIPRINKDSLRLRRLIVRGASSPEGPVPNNRMLGRRRSETLTSFLRARLSVPVDEQNFSSEVVTEDYRLLLVMMERAGDPAVGIVRSLCDRHLPRYEYTILKNKLKQLQGGILWRHLLKDYFPELRAARVVLVFDKPAAPAEPAEVATPELPETQEDNTQLSTLNCQLSRFHAARYCPLRPTCCFTASICQAVTTVGAPSPI